MCERDWAGQAWWVYLQGTQRRHPCSPTKHSHWVEYPDQGTGSGHTNLPLNLDLVP